MGTRKKVINTEATREKFLDALADGSTVRDAAKLIGINPKTAYRWREADKAFATAWAEAYEIGGWTLEAEAQRRAVDGTEKPVFYNGKECGRVREYSDTLLIFLMKGRDPARWCDRVRAARIQAEAEAKQREAEAANNSQASAAVVSFLNGLASQKAAMAKKSASP